jgi:hypothetical protein
MSKSNLDRSSEPHGLSMIGGAAQGGSAKPKQEREAIDRENEQRQEEENPSGAGGGRDRSVDSGSSHKGTVGGLSNDNRSDQERSTESRKD